MERSTEESRENAIATVLTAFEESVSWAASLCNRPPELWLRPMKADAWSVGECLAHMIAWDRFLLERRLPEIRRNAQLGPGPNAQSVNEAAAFRARSGIGRDALVSEFTELRLAIVERVRIMEREAGDFDFSINGTPIRFSDYMLAQARHTLHHQAQIDQAVASFTAG